VFPEQENHSLDDHDELLSTLADRDAPRARAIAERHVLDAGRSLAAWLDHRI
jgi:DNA-binding GntR family transcriptional regulator